MYLTAKIQIFLEGMIVMTAICNLVELFFRPYSKDNFQSKGRKWRGECSQIRDEEGPKRRLGCRSRLILPQWLA